MFQYTVAVIGMLVATAKYRIHNEAAPVHLQRLESLFLLVGWLDAMPAQCIVVIHHHRIDTQLDYIRLDDLQSPEKEGLQKFSKQEHSCPGKSFEESFDLMRRCHVPCRRLDAAGIAGILRKLVEIGQSPTGAIDEKAEYLLEKFMYCETLSAFTDGTEPAIEPFENLNVVQIGHEQGQTRPAGQAIRGGLDTSNFEFILSEIFAMSVHRVLYLLGVFMFAITLVGINKHYNMLSNFRGLFFYGNRLF
jgi:hypothetical protein